MSSKKRKKEIQRNFARISMVLFYRMIYWLPFPIVNFVMRVCLNIAFRFTRKLKKISRETLTLAMGKEKSPQEIEAIILECFDTLAVGMSELLYYSRFPERVTQIFSIDGREHIDQALSQGRGVLAVTAHFGNFALMMLYLARLGYKVNVIMRRPRDEKAGELVLDIMTRVGVNTIYSMPRRECVQKSLRALRNNEILFILMDQNFGSEGNVFVDFFGRQAATAPGPVVLAGRTQSPIVPIFNVREGGRRRRIFVEPEMKLEQRADPDEMILVNVARLTKIIERYIRQYPSEWGWMHRRFKSQAPGSSAQGAVAPERTAAEAGVDFFASDEQKA
jgi:KDO2-lipid IV(A) lauroyltransferase